jgi:hypothetical protein
VKSSRHLFAALASVLLLVAVLAGVTRVVQAQQATPTTIPFGVLLCQYADKPNTYGFTAAGIQTTWTGATATVNGVTIDSSINGMVTEASLGAFNLRGTQVFGWYALPKSLATYTASASGMRDAGADCVAAAQAAGANLSAFPNIAVYFNDVQPVATLGGFAYTASFVPGPRSPLVANMISVYYRGLNSPGIVLHELGHAFGSNSHTDSTSDPLGGGGASGTDPKLLGAGEALPPATRQVGPGWDASRRQLMGFIPASRIVQFSGGTQNYNLSRLTQPLAGVPTVIEVPLPNGAKYVVSARTRVGLDALTNVAGASTNLFANGTSPFNLPFEGVKIELVPPTPNQSTNSQDARVMLSNTSANADPNSADSVWLYAQSFADNANGVRITVTGFDPAGTQWNAQIQVASTGTTGLAPPAPVLAPTSAPSAPPPPLVLTPIANPASDNLEDAPTIRTVPVLFNPVSNATATTQTGERLSCAAATGGAMMSNTRWLKLALPTSVWGTSLTVSTAGSAIPAVVAIYRQVLGGDPSLPFASLVPVACSDGGGNGNASLSFTGGALTYYVQIGGYAGATGNISLSILPTGQTVVPASTSLPPGSWQLQGGLLTQIAAAADGTVMGVSGNNQIWQWTGTGWNLLPGAASLVTVQNASRAFVGIGASLFVGNSSGSAGWTPLPTLPAGITGLNWISVANDGTLYVVDTDGNVHRLNAIGAAWSVVASNAIRVAAQSGTVFYTLQNGRGGLPAGTIQVISNGSATTLPGLLADISVDPGGNLWGVSSNNNIYHWNGTNWDLVPGGLTQVAVGNFSTVWGLKVDQAAQAGTIYQWR